MHDIKIFNLSSRFLGIYKPFNFFIILSKIFGDGGMGMEIISLHSCDSKKKKGKKGKITS